MTCGVGHRRSSDPVLLWLWHRLAVTALIRPPAWEPPYAAGAALEKAKKKKKKKKKFLPGVQMLHGHFIASAHPLQTQTLYVLDLRCYFSTPGLLSPIAWPHTSAPGSLDSMIPFLHLPSHPTWLVCSLPWNICSYVTFSLGSFLNLNWNLISSQC